MWKAGLGTGFCGRPLLAQIDQYCHARSTMTDKRRPLIAGNWKMNGLKAAVNELAAIGQGAEAVSRKADLLICPPATLLFTSAAAVIGSKVAIGAQDCQVADLGSPGRDSVPDRDRSPLPAQSLPTAQPWRLLPLRRRRPGSPRRRHEPAPCPNQECRCHIGYVHAPDLPAHAHFGEGILERIPRPG